MGDGPCCSEQCCVSVVLSATGAGPWGRAGRVAGTSGGGTYCCRPGGGSRQEVAPGQLEGHDIAAVALDDPELLLRVEVPQFYDAFLLPTVQEGAVDGQGEDGLAEIVIVAAETHDLALLPRIPLLESLVFLILFYLPQLDAPVSAATYQNLLV